MNTNDTKFTVSVNTEALERELALLRETMERAQQPPATVELTVDPPTGLVGLLLAGAVSAGVSQKKLTRRQLFGLR